MHALRGWHVHGTYWQICVHPVPLRARFALRRQRLHSLHHHDPLLTAHGRARNRSAVPVHLHCGVLSSGRLVPAVPRGHLLQRGAERVHSLHQPDTCQLCILGQRHRQQLSHTLLRRRLQQRWRGRVSEVPPGHILAGRRRRVQGVRPRSKLPMPQHPRGEQCLRVRVLLRLFLGPDGAAVPGKYKAGAHRFRHTDRHHRRTPTDQPS